MFIYHIVVTFSPKFPSAKICVKFLRRLSIQSLRTSKIIFFRHGSTQVLARLLCHTVLDESRSISVSGGTLNFYFSLGIGSVFDSQHGKEIVLHSGQKGSRAHQRPIQWVLGAVSVVGKRLGCEAEH
jgi:hypothetical protein